MVGRGCVKGRQTIEHILDNVHTGERLVKENHRRVVQVTNWLTTEQRTTFRCASSFLLVIVSMNKAYLVGLISLLQVVVGRFSRDGGTVRLIRKLLENVQHNNILTILIGIR